ncbi:MAG TPA: hypothetical protein DET40_06680 [Lentisphaeria bacterium]|nr:MAG: hypothetical protein A2X45_01110 [Lentisphaerae bacterium GWF2_50_93]HCE43214.1 hypothetical protein [Lentisphaeria bacterium]
MKDNLVQSLSRGIDILRFIAESEDGRRVNEIADEIGVKPPAAYNLIRTLVSRGLVEKRNSKCQLGPALVELAGAHLKRHLITSAKKVMQELAGKFPDFTFVFSELAGRDICVRLLISPDCPSYVQEPSSMTFQYYATASGLLFQAFSDDETLERIRENSPFSEDGIKLWTSMDELEKYLSRIRNEGVAVKPFDDSSLFAVAVPVFNDNKRIVAVIGASTRKKIIQDNPASAQKIIKFLKEEALEIK